MYVINKVFLNQYESDSQFPKLKRFFKKEVVEENVENPHLALIKWLKFNEPGITYSIAKMKGV